MTSNKEFDTNPIVRAQQALKLMNETEESDKVRGLDLADEVLTQRAQNIVEYGYDQVIFKELLKLTKFEESDMLKRTIKLLLAHYGSDEICQDEMMEAFLFRYGMSTDYRVSRECVSSISLLTDMMGHNVAKHSRQIMQAADLNNFLTLNDIFIEILENLKSKLPERKITP